MHAQRSACPGRLASERNAIIRTLSANETLSGQSLPRMVDLIGRFCLFAQRVSEVDSFAAVSPSDAAAFVTARTSAGDPAPATMHLRRSALRLLFRTARELGFGCSDPTLDLVLPPRSQLKTRSLTDDEVAVCRAASLQTLTSTRLPAAWALAEASARSAELGHIQIGDLDLAGGRAWLHGSPRTEPRWGLLTGWGGTQLNRRIRELGNDAERPVLYGGRSGTNYHRQAASCAAIADTLRRAGLASEPDTRPLSVAAWAGRQVLAETGRIDEVALRLGVRSLDRAAGLISFDWTLDTFNESDER